MANWGAAFQELGVGLRQFAGQRLDLEARKIEAMRQEALRQLDRDHDDAMAKRHEVHDVDMEKLREKHDTEEAVATRKNQTDLFDKGEKAQDKRQAASFAAQSSLYDKKSLADAVEQANQSYTQHVVAIEKSRQDIQLKRAELVGKATETMADADTIKAITDPLDKMLLDLDGREDVAKQTHILTVRRLHAGGYGKTEVLTPDEVRKIIGAKGPNDEQRASTDVTETPTTPATPAPAVAAPAPPKQAAAPAAAPAQASNELFPPKPAAAPPANGILELIAANQKTVNDTAPPKMTISEALKGLGDRLSSRRQQLDTEQEAKRRRDDELRMAIR